MRPTGGAAAKPPPPLWGAASGRNHFSSKCYQRCPLQDGGRRSPLQDAPGRKNVWQMTFCRLSEEKGAQGGRRLRRRPPCVPFFFEKSTKSHLPDIFFARGHLAEDFPTSCGGLFKTWQSPGPEDLQRTFILWVNASLYRGLFVITLESRQYLLRVNYWRLIFDKTSVELVSHETGLMSN